MTFPDTPLGLTVELLLSGTWTAITSLVRGKDRLVVGRGRSSEGTQVDPSKGKLTVDNRDGNLSPRNPTGTYYGKIGRNTRMRARLDSGPPGYLLLPASGKATTPDSASTSITGDVDIRVDMQSEFTRIGSNGLGLAAKYTAAGDQRSWAFYVNNNGTLSVAWSPDGTLAARITKTSTVALTIPDDGRLAVRVTLDVNNGAAGNDVKFYTSDSMAGTWTQLGATVTTAGTTSIKDSTAPTVAGGVADLSGVADAPTGRLYGFQLYDGIGGTLHVDVDFDDLVNVEAGATTFVDATNGATWTVSGDASTVQPAIRFQGEISEWPSRWDVTGTDVYTPVEASGILRRLQQGSTPLKSTLRRGLTTLATTPKAYWPCEDGRDATQLASAVGGPPMGMSTVGVLGPASFASFSDFKCSDPIPTLGGSEWIGQVPAFTGTGLIHVLFLLHIATGAAVAGQSITNIYTTGGIWRWQLDYAAADGGLRIRAFDIDGNTLEDNTSGFAVNDKLLRVSLALQQNGANVDWSLDTSEVGTATVGGSSGTVTGKTVSRCTRVQINNGGDLGADVAVGHISVHDEILDLLALDDELAAFSGETAGRRVQRLCGEEDISFRGVGDLDASAAMGPQLPAELVDLLREAAAADLGILYEPRDLFGLSYRTRESLYRQTARLELDYAAGHLSGIEPTDDDQAVRNDVTAKRVDGSSFRRIQETGPLSILAPPDGVGRYDEQVTLSLESDGQLPDQAGWRLHLGTVDEARYPVLSVDLARAVFAADSALSLAAQDLDEGDRLTVDNPPAWLPPDLISQLAQGFVETMSNFTHTIDVNCSPETPWGQAAIYDDGVSRYSSDGSTLGASLTTTATSVSVVTPSGPLWSHADSNFFILVGGEWMWVTAISGAASPQTFTVTRSANNVVKTHVAGETVELAFISVYVQ